MVRCPVCTKIQLVYVQGFKGTSCYYCGARWIQEGAEQDRVVAPRIATAVIAIDEAVPGVSSFA